MIVRDGPDGEVYLPSVYSGPAAAEAARLARITEWTGGDGAPVRGVGQRTFLVGEEALPILDLKELRFGEDA